MRSHAIDIIQPPGIGIAAIAGMDELQAIVTAALAANSRADMPRKAGGVVCPGSMSRRIARPAHCIAWRCVSGGHRMDTRPPCLRARPRHRQAWSMVVD
jgi:hypothetical protein